MSDRLASPQHPAMNYPAARMLVRQKITHLTHVEKSGWARVPDFTKLDESCIFTCHFSDGTTRERTATMKYKPGQRERIVEALAKGDGSDREVKMMRNIIYTRKKLEQQEHAWIQKNWSIL